jgi:Glycosyl hydrolase family 12
MKNYLLLALILALAACSNDQIVTESSTSNGDPSYNSTADPGAKAGTVTGQYGTYDDPDYQWAYMSNNIWNWNNSGSDHSQYLWYTNINSWGVKAYTTFGSNPAYSEVKSYGSIVYGSHYGRKSKNTNGFPIQVKNLKSNLDAVWSCYTVNTDNNSVWNASYDIWLDPSNNNNSTNKYEIMIWNIYKNQYPVGNKIKDKVWVNNANYEVWQGNNGINEVLTFRLIGGSGYFAAPLKSFITTAVNWNWMSNNVYLTSIQAGFEICTAGKGKADNQKANFVTSKFSLKI